MKIINTANIPPEAFPDLTPKSQGLSLHNIMYHDPYQHANHVYYQSGLFNGCVGVFYRLSEIEINTQKGPKTIGTTKQLPNSIFIEGGNNCGNWWGIFWAPIMDENNW